MCLIRVVNVIYVIENRDKMGLYWVNGIMFVLHKGSKVTMLKLHKYMVGLRFPFLEQYLKLNNCGYRRVLFSIERRGYFLKGQ